MLDKVVKTVASSTKGATVGGAVGGILGGGPGMAVGGILGGAKGLGIPGLENTPLDPGTWVDTLKNIPGMPGGAKKEKATYGSDIKDPTLSGYDGIDTLGGKQTLNASTIQNSPWMGMALDRQAADQSRALDSSVGNQAGALAGARSNLAMKGGLTGGASERLGMAGMNDAANARQGILNQGMSDRAGLGMQNAQMQTGIDQFNAGQTQGANQFNVGQSIADLGRKNDQGRFKYGEEMKLKGAAMSGQAMENSGKK